jgi:hypothetical protein
MVETELKFQIPPQRRAAVLRAVATASVAESHLRVWCFDTGYRPMLWSMTLSQ